MKSILLATTATIAFAGMASAEAHTGINFSGDFTLGYNDTDWQDDNAVAIDGGADNYGFYFDASLTITGATELDNGLTAGFSVGFDLVDGGEGGEDGIFDDMDVEVSGYEFSLTGEGAGLYFGDTATAAEVNFSAVSGTEAGFMDSEDLLEDTIGSDDAAGIRGEYATDMYAVALSYGIDLSAPASPLVGLQLSASADVGPVTVELGYQQEDAGYGIPEAMGIAVGGTFAGADVKVSYVETEDNDLGTAGAQPETSTGIEVSYAVSDMITVGGYYTMNDVAGDFFGISADYASGPITVSVFYDDENGSEDYGVEGSYDVGNGIMVYAGLVDSGEDFYVAGEYDLGGGASLLVSYADDGDGDEDADDDDIGANGYQVGTTVEVSFEF